MVEAGRVNQIVGECFVKAAHIILGARICQSSRAAPRQGPKCWVCTLRYPPHLGHGLPAGKAVSIWSSGARSASAPRLSAGARAAA